MSTLYFWGKPITKELFTATDGHHLQVDIQTSIKSISCGDRHCLLLANGVVYGFGDNSEGQLGHEEVKSSGLGLLQVQINSRCKIVSLSCGWEHTLLLDQIGQVYSSGRGEHGELGRGKTKTSFSFEVVIKGARQISAGRDHSLALCGSKVMGWGNSRDGQLGLLIKKNYCHPHELNVYPCNLIFAGAKYSLFVTSKGVFGTGINQMCQLGLGHENDVHLPRRLAIDEEICKISGGNYCAAGTSNGQWYLWGTGGFGTFKYPTKMSFLKNAHEVSMGMNFGVLSRNGQVWVWGCNRWGELGSLEQSKQFASEAEQITNLGLESIACGGNFMVGFVNSKIQTNIRYSMQQGKIPAKRSQIFQTHEIKQKYHRRHESSENKCRQSAYRDYYELKDSDNKVLKNQGRLFFDETVEGEPSKTEGLMTIYNNWQIEEQPKKIVHLSSTLKKRTDHRVDMLERQNKLLREKLFRQRQEKQKIKDEYLSMMNMSQNNRFFNKMLQTHACQDLRSPLQQATHEQFLNSKLASLRTLLQSVNR